MAEVKVSNLIIGVTSEEKQFAKGADEATNALRKQKNGAKEAAKETNKLKNSLKGATAEAKHHASSFQKVADAVKRIAFYRAIRSAIKAVTQAMREGINNLYNYSAALNSVDAARAKSTMDNFATTALYVKNSIGAALMPILQALVPIVNAVADAFVYAANAVNQFIHMLKGEGTFTKAKRYAVEYADALGGAGKAAKELKKQVFGFDELNIFNAPSGGGGGGAAVPDYSKMFEEAAVGDWGKLPGKIKKHLAEITGYVSAASLAVGAILALSGINVPLGIGLMAAGTVGVMASAVHWNGTNEKVKSVLAQIEMTVGGFLLGLGAILALSNANLPLGIGLIAAGAVSLASGASLNWDVLGKTVDEKIGFITATVGAAFLFLGAVLALTGNIPLGIGLLVGGALGLAAGVSMSDTLKNLISSHIGEVEAIIGAAFLFLGAVAAFTGHIPLGIGLLVLGAAAIGAGMANLNDDLKKRIADKLDAIKKLVTISTLALGGILIFVNPALGLPLLITGLALAGQDIEWDGLNKKVKEAWEKVKQTGRNIKKDLLGWWDSIKSFFKQIVSYNESVKLTPSMQWHDNTPSPPTNGKLFAEGGIPETGSYFWAGEAGPELVAQVGSKTTVTNQEQFTAGMEGIMDNTNSVIMQAASALIQAIQSKPVPSIRIGDRDIVSMYDRGKTLAGGALVE